jgi:hypothetical protein
MGESSESSSDYMENRSYPESYPGHNNHLHFCLSPENQIVNQTCQEGLD